MIIPAYNEEANIEDTIREVLDASLVLPGAFELIVVDDCSTDGTSAVVRRLMAETGTLRLVHNKTNLGFGGAFREGVRCARMDSCVLVPGDNAVHSDSLRAIFSRLGEAEVIVPFVTNTDVRDHPRRLLSRLFVLMLNVLSGLWLRYYNGFNVYPTATLKGMEFTSGFAFSAQIVIRLLRAGHSFIEVPVQVHERVAGKSKAISVASVWSVAKAMISLAREIYAGPRLWPLWAAVAALCCVPIYLAGTPFRGEHWALLDAFEGASGLIPKLQTVSHFVCFGVSRYQPFAFFVDIVAYVLFGTWFAGHYALSLLLHFLYAASGVALLELLDDSPRRPVGRGYAFQRYPLEMVFLLVAFPGADTVTWTFFQYVQLAASLGVLGTVLVLRGEGRSALGRFVGFALVAVATLIYEPFLCVMALLAANSALGFFSHRRQGRSLLEPLLPALFIASVAQKYLTTYVPFGFDRLPVALPLADTRLGRVAYMLAVFVANLARNLLLPSSAVRNNIYDMESLDAGWIPTIAAVGAALVVVCLVVGISRSRFMQSPSLRAWLAPLQARTIVLFAGVGLFSIICAARSSESLYCTRQFRYSYVLLPFMFALAAAYVRRLSGRLPLVYPALLVLLLASNAWSTASHFARVRRDLAPLAAYVAEIKLRHPPDEQVVRLTVDGLRRRRLNAPPNPFLYNATQCMTEVVRARR